MADRRSAVSSAPGSPGRGADARSAVSSAPGSPSGGRGADARSAASGISGTGYNDNKSSVSDSRGVVDSQEAEREEKRRRAKSGLKPDEPKDDEKEAVVREFQVLDPNPAAAANTKALFAPNSVSTAKYSFVLLMPDFIVWKNLYEQFHKLANLYFLLISFLQLIPGLSPTGKFTTLVPLIIVLSVTMVKDFMEDIQRHRSDAELNGRTTRAWRDGQWNDIQWKDVRVGDVLRIDKNESFPADLILIWSSLSEGMGYIETSSLDGETNLKIRKAPPALYRLFNPSQPDSIAGKVVCETPNERLYNFEGYYQKQGREKIPVTADNILLRGADLRNTPDAIGIVVFTGNDSKLMRNSSAKASKMSRVDHVTNKQIVYVFVVLLILCFGSTVGAVIFRNRVKKSWYLDVGVKVSIIDSNMALFAISSFGTFLILFNNLIPISLYVSLEMVKVFIAYVINNDLNMYHDDTDTPALTRSSSLVEELGQIEYIFSDKTGTLTCNMMDFLKFTTVHVEPFNRRLSVHAYGTGTTEIGRAAAVREGREINDDRPPGWTPGPDGFQFYDPKINDYQWCKQQNAEDLEFFLVFLAVCHDVIPEVDQETGDIVYQAASPDEACLVKAARSLGVVFCGRSDDSVTVQVCGVPQQWEVLTTIEFNSTRKRMSVIVRSPKGRLMILTKGADTVVYDRLRKNDPQKVVAQTETQDLITTYAAEGLRTLVLGKADLDEHDYYRWAKRYLDASTSLVNRQEKMMMVAEEIETDLELVGTTAIEDKLQGGVPQTIELLSKAGIKIWVLTGDKQETAINIGFACSLLHDEMGIFMFDDCTKSNVFTVCQCYVEDARASSEQDLGLVIQGDMLEAILNARNRRESEVFLSLATHCRAVICCRVSPLQKAQVVKLVRDNIETVTLAIGDGANDVSMIQAAHVGIGISGLEGLQAARASDFSIAQFRFLQRLLLVHGRYAYRRVAKVTLFSFYKNILLYLTQFWFASMNLWTGQSLYDAWALSLWNMAFAAFPIIFLGILDRDVEPHMLLSTSMFPELYQDGVRSIIFNTLSFWMYQINALIQSVFIYIFCAYAWDFAMNQDGMFFGMPGAGITTYTCAVFLATIKVGLEIQSWTIPNVISIAYSIVAWYAFLLIYGLMFGWIRFSDFAIWYGVPLTVLAQPIYYFTVILVVTMCLLRELAWKLWRHSFQQKLVHIVQELGGQAQKQKLPFSRKDVVRSSPHLLPKFDSLRPYDPVKGGGDPEAIGEADVNMNVITSVSKKALAEAQQALLGSNSRFKPPKKTSKGKKSGELTHGQPAFSSPGKMNIKDVVLDDILL